MASLQASTLLFSSSSSSSSLCCSSKRINAAIHVPKLGRVISLSVQKLPTRKLVEESNIRDGFTNTIPTENISVRTSDEPHNSATSMATAELYAILEAVADRAQMHTNIGEQRNNWNSLLLNSINMITLTAATMAGLAATSGGTGLIPFMAFKASSTLLFSAATGMLLVMNKTQPSQLAEEQRNAVRLFRQLHTQIKTIIAIGVPTQMDVENTMEKVLALDRSYPLPLLGTMLEKFPAKLDPAVWWPSNQSQKEGNKLSEEKHNLKAKIESNGWTEKLEEEMREITEVLKRKDAADYERLGNLVLKINKVLAISGPSLSAIAAVASAFVGHGSWAAIVAVVAGVLASTVSTLEHGGQVGMVFEMYRNAAGFFQLLEESIDSTLEESEAEKRESGELFEMKVALQLGRSLSQLRDLAAASASSRRDGNAVDEFASKLF